MASATRVARLRAIRDNLEKELQDETARRAALVAAGNPPPATYNVGGKSVSWNEYLEKSVNSLKEIEDLILKSGADEGGIPEASVRLWS